MTAYATNGIALVLTISALALTGCSKHVIRVHSPAGIGVDILEVRVNGAGPAADTLAIFLANTGDDLASSAKPVFKAEDAGTACYDWTGRNKLNIRISGGYVDAVAPNWKGANNRVVDIAYQGTSGCEWRPESKPK